MFELQYTCNELLNQHQCNEQMIESLKLNKVENLKIRHKIRKKLKRQNVTFL